MAKTSDGVHFEISADADNAVKELGSVEKSLNSTQKAAEELQRTIKKSGNVDIINSQLGQEISSQIGGTVEEALTQLKETTERGASDAAAGAVSAFNSNFIKIADGLNTAGQMIENGFGRILKHITAAAASVNGFVGLVVQRSLSIGGSFEGQMTSVAAISGATAEELEKLTAKARTMGASLPISAKDAAEAMTLLAQRGTSVRDIIASVSDVSSLAISQGVSMAQAAELLGSAITNFGIAVEDAGQITDMFNNASNQSALNMNKMSDALKYAGPAASAAGLSLEETLAAMETLANAGLEGSMIGTGLAGVLQRLADKSDILGVKTKKLDGSLRPIKEVFSELQTRGLTLGEATEEFGALAAKSAINLTKYGSALEQNEKNLKQWGSTQAAVQGKMGTWSNTWNAFQSAVEELHIEIFEQIKDQSKDAMTGVISLTRTFSEWINKTQIASKSFNAFLSGLGINLSAGDNFQRILNKFNVDAFADKVKNFAASTKSIASAIIGFFDSIKTPIIFLLEHLDTLGKISFWGWIIGKGLQVPIAIINIANAFTQLKTALTALSLINLAPLISFLSTPIGWAVAGTAAVGAGAYYIYSKTQEAREAEQEKERIEQELKSLNNKAEIEVNLKVRTGFEEIPESYQKASSEIQRILDQNVAAMQNVFRDRVIEAIKDVNASAADLGEQFKGTADDISNALASQITRALQGNKRDFEQLPEYWKKVTERLVEMGVKAGQVTGNIKELIETYKAAKDAPTANGFDKYASYTKEISSAVDTIINSFSAQVTELSQYLGGQSMELAVDVQLDAANQKLKDFIKNASKNYKIPQDIIEAGLLNRLKELSAQNNRTAQSIINGWQSARDKISNFISRAKDAVEYLGASPAQFTPALDKLTSGIQKIDPVTGRVTEAFKKAHEVLKEWNKTTFDKLAQRIKSIKKAVEGGFLSTKQLENEYKNLSEQLKIQIKAELEPIKNQFSDEKAYYGVAASEYMTRLNELGGTAFVAQAKDEFLKAGAMTGEAIGRKIIDSLQQAQFITIKTQNGMSAITRQEAQVQTQQPQNESQIIQAVTDSIKPLLSGLESNQAGYNAVSQNVINSVTPATAAIQSLVSSLDTTRSALTANTDAVNKSQAVINSVIEVLKNDTSSQIFTQNLINELTSLTSRAEAGQTKHAEAMSDAANTITSINPAIQTLAAALSAMNSSASENTAAMTEIQASINSAAAALEKLPASNTFNIEINQSGFTVQSQNDANRIANSTAAAIRNGIGNGM